MTPLVTAVVTAYNLERYIAEAIESALGQTYTPLEVVVVDDGSTDRTPEVCAAFGSRIRYVRQANRGASEARNTGLRHARGELIAFLDGDDIWERDHVATAVAAWQRFPRSGLIATDGIQFDDEGRVLSTSLLTRVGDELIRRSDGRVWSGRCYPQLLAGTPICTPSQAMVPTRVFAAIGCWDARLDPCEDYDLWLRIARRLPITLLAQQSVRWRYRPSSLSGPLELRQFAYRLWQVPVLVKQLRVADSAHRPAVRARLRGLLLEASRAAYYGHEVRGRLWAARYLLRVAAAGRRPHLVAPYLLGVLCPSPLRRLAARLRQCRLGRAGSPIARATTGRKPRSGLSLNPVTRAGKERRV